MLTKQRINGRVVLALALILLLIAASLLAVGAGKVAAAGELLRYGSRGESVRQVQSRLNKLGYWCGTQNLFGIGDIPVFVLFIGRIFFFRPVSAGKVRIRRIARRTVRGAGCRGGGGAQPC